MPYTEIAKETVDGKEKWCFHNKATGRRICSDTKEGAVAAMRARYAFAQEMKYIDPFFNSMIKTDEED
jgi:hypothetical protein